MDGRNFKESFEELHQCSRRCRNSSTPTSPVKFNTTKGSKSYNNRNFQIKQRPTFGHATETLLSGEINQLTKRKHVHSVRRDIGPMNVSFPDMESRKGQLIGKCFICLRTGHTIKDCKIEKQCLHCGQVKNHHRSLCPNKFGKEICTQRFSTLLSYGEKVIMQNVEVSNN